MVVRGKIKYPNSTIPNFISLSDDILAAAQTYNLTHTIVRISNIVVGINYIDIFLDVSSTISPSIIGHKLTSFSQELYNVFGWSAYSTKLNKLFKFKLLNCILLTP